MSDTVVVSIALAIAWFAVIAVIFARKRKERDEDEP